MTARIIIICALCIVTSVWAGPRVKTEFNTYTVYLGDNRNIKTELNQASPILENGRIYHGRTDWKTKWDFRWKKEHELCRISSVTTSVKIVYILPKARSLPTDSKQKKRYQEYYSSLLAHEKGHGQFGIDMANEIERRLSKMKSSGNCEVFSANVNKKAYEILEKYKRLDAEYDVVTGHGKTQGAFLN